MVPQVARLRLARSLEAAVEKASALEVRGGELCWAFEDGRVLHKGCCLFHLSLQMVFNLFLYV